MKPSGFGSMIAAGLLSLAAGTAAAQRPPAPVAYKIGFVNADRVMRDSRASQQVQKSLEAEFQKRAREIDGGPKADIERRRNALVEDMAQRRDDALKKFVEKTNGIIRRVAEAEKFDIVFVEVAYANARTDITDKVIKALDAAR